MSMLLSVLGIGLMVIVLIIAAGSLVIVATIPLARLWQRRRSSDQQD